MSRSEELPQEGLRLRKKRATENAIETAAVDLALELGIDKVTVEMICERADISRSTFFNYFAGRDYAIVGRAIESLQGEAAAAVLSATPDDLVRGVIHLIFASIGHQNVNTEVARKRAQLNAEQPAAQRIASAGLVESSMSLIPVVAEWLAQHPEHQRLASPMHEATLAVALAHGAFGGLLVSWSEGNGDISAKESELDLVLADLRTLLA